LSQTQTQTRNDFASLGLADGLLAALREEGYQTPTPIQARAIPPLLEGRDLLGIARTGTGKTAAFALPIIQHLSSRPIERRAQFSVRALVVAPTRELAAQIDESFKAYGRKYPLTHAVVFGGVGKNPQIQAVWRGIDMLVATPGRLLDLMNEGKIRLDRVEIAVLDEADRMFDLGFRDDIYWISRHLPPSGARQTLLLSATMPPEVERLAQRYQRDAERIDLSNNSVACERVEQFYCTVDNDRKFGLLVRLLLQERPQQAIVFRRTKRGADQLYLRLKQRLQGVEVIHGDLQQRVRDNVMKRFRAGKTRLLIATDVVGRGIDVSGISHIINYDVPEYCDDYVHRIGRTGRISSDVPGRAFTFATKEEGDQLTRIEMRINNLLNEYKFENFEAYTPRKPRQHVDDLVEPERELVDFHVA